jgi:ubiquitin C-terminal hydrolase
LSASDGDAGKLEIPMPKMQSTTDIADNAGAKMTKQRQTYLRMTSENDARNGVSMSIDSNKRGKKVKQKIEVLMKNVSYKRQENKPTIPGIRNLGCTCYLSVSLQTLYSIPQFLLKLYNSYAKLSSEKELPLTKAFLEIALTIGAFKQVDVPLLSSETVQGTSKSKAADPSALKVQMDVLTNRFAGYEQRDAHEFLGALIDFLHEELADEEGSNSDTADDEVATTVVTTDLTTDEYFHTKVRVCLECMSCGYSRSREEFYRHLSVDVGEDADGESWGVEQSLEWFFQAEIVSSTVRSVRVALLPLKRWRLFLGQYFFMWSLGCYNRSTAFTQRFHC